ncbi:unnamed protein product [Boreogadus saida]
MDTGMWEAQLGYKGHRFKFTERKPFCWTFVNIWAYVTVVVSLHLFTPPTPPPHPSVTPLFFGVCLNKVGLHDNVMVMDMSREDSDRCHRPRGFFLYPEGSGPHLGIFWVCVRQGSPTCGLCISK